MIDWFLDLIAGSQPRYLGYAHCGMEYCCPYTFHIDDYNVIVHFYETKHRRWIESSARTSDVCFYNPSVDFWLRDTSRSYKAPVDFDGKR